MMTTPLVGSFTWSHDIGLDARPRLLAWDGCLHNAGDLRWRLGRTLDDARDASLVVCAYERGGIDGLADLLGDWSAVIFDPRDRSVVLASDYMGVRPLYYRTEGHRVQWASRLEPLLDAGSGDCLDEEYAREFLECGGSPNRTPSPHVRVVPPGEGIRLTPGRVSRQRFWTAPVGDTIRYRDERRYEEQFRMLFREAVSVRLQTTAPVLAELSGGFDSSSVLCMAAQLIRSGAVPTPGIVAVTYLVPGAADDPFAQQVAHWCGVERRTLCTRAHQIVGGACHGDARPEGASPLQRAAAALAAEHGARVLMTGQAGDVVAGNWLDDSIQITGALRRGQFARVVREAVGWSRVLRVPVPWIVARAARACLDPAALAREADLDHGSSNADHSLTRRLLDTSRDPASSRAIGPWRDGTPARRKHWLAVERLRTLRALQRPEAMHGLDYTHPFSHRPLVEFLMAIPAHVLCRPGEPRRLMRRALGDLWPPSLRGRRSKSLFGSAYCTALRAVVDELPELDTWEVVRRGWLDRASLASRLQRLRSGLECNEPQLRRIVLLESWIEYQRLARNGTGAAA
jgi:asparagine synthase (glutamine-hydrolysing)